MVDGIRPKGNESKAESARHHHGNYSAARKCKEEKGGGREREKKTQTKTHQLTPSGFESSMKGTIATSVIAEQYRIARTTAAGRKVPQSDKACHSDDLPGGG